MGREYLINFFISFIDIKCWLTLKNIKCMINNKLIIYKVSSSNLILKNKDTFSKIVMTFQSWIKNKCEFLQWTKTKISLLSLYMKSIEKFWIPKSIRWKLSQIVYLKDIKFYFFLIVILLDKFFLENSFTHGNICS